MRHKAGNEVNIAAQSIQLGNHDRAFRAPCFLQGGGQLGSPFQCVCTFPRYSPSAWRRSALTRKAWAAGTNNQKQTGKTDPQKPKADDKAYNAALKSVPDKAKPDPWQGAR